MDLISFITGKKPDKAKKQFLLKNKYKNLFPGDIINPQNSKEKFIYGFLDKYGGLNQPGPVFFKENNEEHPPIQYHLGEGESMEYFNGNKKIAYLPNYKKTGERCNFETLISKIKEVIHYASPK